jgi:hypothetical protein
MQAMTETLEEMAREYVGLLKTAPDGWAITATRNTGPATDAGHHGPVMIVTETKRNSGPHSPYIITFRYL